MTLKATELKKLMGLYESSGLNVTAFCRLHGISKYRFYNYRRQLKDLSESALEPKPKFEEVMVSSSTKPIESNHAVIYFPNQIRCEFELKSREEQLCLLKELASLC